MSPRAKRIIFGFLAPGFITLTILLVRAGRKVRFDDRDYWIGFLGLCLLLETFYVALYFSLKALLFRRPQVVAAITAVVGALVALPVTLMFGLLVFIVAGGNDWHGNGGVSISVGSRIHRRFAGHSGIFPLATCGARV